MSTSLHDVPSHTAFALALAPQTLTEDATGPAVELPDADGPAFAVVQLGGLAGGTTVSVEFEQSGNGSSWSAVSTDIPAQTAGGVTAVTFTRPARYLRCQVTLAGTSPQAEIAVLIGQQKKVV
jgi:hypothetical protein